MFFSEPAADGPTVAVPSFLTQAAVTVGVVVDGPARRHAAAVPRPGRPGLALHPLGAVSQCRVSGPFGASVGRPGARGGVWARPCDAVEALLRQSVTSDYPFIARRRGTSSTPAASGSGRCWCCSPRSSATRTQPGRRPGRGGRRAHPPGDALSRRRHGRGAAAPGGAVGERPLGQHGRDPHRATSSSPGPRTSLADLGPEAVRIQARTFERLVIGQIRETVGPVEGEDPVEHYLSVVGRQDRLAHRDVGPVRRDALRARTRPMVEMLTELGERIGVAFQLSDDLLDVAQRLHRVGQDAGHRPARGCRRRCRSCTCSAL